MTARSLQCLGRLLKRIRALDETTVAAQRLVLDIAKELREKPSPPIIESARAGDTAKVASLLDGNPSLIYATNRRRHTTQYWACAEGWMDARQDGSLRDGPGSMPEPQVRLLHFTVQRWADTQTSWSLCLTMERISKLGLGRLV